VQLGSELGDLSLGLQWMLWPRALDSA
jgi:hypothetical protein